MPLLGHSWLRILWSWVGRPKPLGQEVSQSHSALDVSLNYLETQALPACWAPSYPDDVGTRHWFLADTYF